MKEMATHTINITFDDEEYESLMKKKNGTSWKEFILSLCKEEVKIEKVEDYLNG